jgi:hypothetical protein
MLAESRLHVPKGGLWLPGHGLLVDVRERPDELEELFDRMGRKLPPIAGGAFASSGMYLLNFIDIFDATQLAIDLSLTTHKWALYTNTETPNFSTEVSYAATNEVAGAGYTAGGRTIAAGGGSPTVTESPAGTLMYDQNDMVWPAATITARGSKMYADALAGDNLVVAQAFSGDVTSTAGNFTITEAAGGVLNLDITP